MQKTAREFPTLTTGAPAIALACAIKVSGQERAPIDPARTAPEGTCDGLDVLHYDLEIGLPPPGGTGIDGCAVIRLKATRSGLTRAVVDLTGVTLATVALDGAITVTAYADRRLSVPLPRPTTPDDTIVLDFIYHGTSDNRLMFGSNPHGRPVAFADNRPSRARFSVPAIDPPSDKVTARITVHAPAGWDVVANGALTREPIAGPPAADGTPRTTWVWSLAEPVAAYNFVIGAAATTCVPMVATPRGAALSSPDAGRCVEVAAWRYAEDVPARLPLGHAAEVLD